MAAERTVTVRLALDASAFAEELSRVANILRLAGVVIADPSVTDDEPVDRTGLCDHCDKPQTGGAAGGGISPEHWCDDHRPADSALDYSDDTDAPEPWTPKVGDRVIATTGGLLSGPGLVTDIRERSGIPLVYVLLDGGPVTSLIFYGDEVTPETGQPTDAPEPADEQPASVGPVRLHDTMRAAYWNDPIDERDAFEFGTAHVRQRLAQYPAGATAAEVYADWFGAR